MLFRSVRQPQPRWPLVVQVRQRAFLEAFVLRCPCLDGRLTQERPGLFGHIGEVLEAVNGLLNRFNPFRWIQPALAEVVEFPRRIADGDVVRIILRLLPRRPRKRECLEAGLRGVARETLTGE